MAGAHAVLGALLVGAQAFVTWWLFQPASAEHGAERDRWRALERRYRILALLVFLASVGSGAAYLRKTLVSTLLLTSTPYGPLLVAKLTMGFVFLACLLLGPLGHGDASGRSSVGAKTAALLATAAMIGSVVISVQMRYV